MFAFAYHRDEFIVCEPTVAAVLAILADLAGPTDDDCAVWVGLHCVCVRRGDGAVVWLRPEHKPAGEAASAA